MAAMSVDCRVWEDVGGTWSEVFREVESLDWLHKNSSCTSSHSHGVPLRENKSSKASGSKKKSKPKLCFHFQSRQKGFSSVVSDGIEKTPSDIYSLLGEVSASVPRNGISIFQPMYCRGDFQRLQRKAC